MPPAKNQKLLIPAPYGERVQLLRRSLAQKTLSGILILQPENRRYLSGFRPTDPQFNESSGFLIIGRSLALLGTDSRYEGEAGEQARGFYPFIYRKGLEASWPEIQGMISPIKRLAFEAQSLSFHTYQRVKKLLRSNKKNAFLPAFQVVEELRARKERREVATIRRSLEIAESAFQAVQKILKPGKTEKEIAWQVKQWIHQGGGDDQAFEPIVASGPNAALPHAEPTDREIQKREPILFDLGSKFQGYCSDLSRTVFLGPPTDRFKEVYSLVRQAQIQAEKGMRAGMTTAAADSLARSVIEKGGYGKYFKHSLGHGVGLATHELPTLSPVKPTPLLPGMVVTVEPGIYLPGWGGVRLEDMVVIQEKRTRCLNRDKTFYTFD